MTESENGIGTARMIGVTGDSWLSSRDVHSITEVMRKYIGMAESNVTITTFSLAYNKDTVEIFEDALERGVSVSIIASDLTETSPTTAGFVATVAAHAEFGSLIAEISAVETSAEYMSI